MVLAVPVAGAAQSQTRDLFVSQTTGVGVGSVWGVFVGVSRYQHPGLDLTYAHQDAEALYQFYSTQFQGQIPADHFQVLINEEAKRGNVLRAIQEVLRRAQPEDLVIIFLAMHGLLDSTGEDLYFMTHDADPNFPEDDGISRDDVAKQLRRSKAQKIVLLLDACHTGAFSSSNSLVALRGANAVDINRLLGAMGQAQPGRAVFSSSSAAEPSREGEQFCGGHGAFTCALLTGLQGEADTNRNGLVELRELYDFTYHAVKTSTEGYQNPVIEGMYDNGLPLAFAKGSVALPQAGIQPSGSGGASSEELVRLQAQLQGLQKRMNQADAASQASNKVERERLDTERQEAERARAEEERKLAEAQARKESAQKVFAVLEQRLLEEKARLTAILREQNLYPAEKKEKPTLVAKAPFYSAPQRMAKKITGKDGAPMVLIPEGEFLMGSDQEEDDTEQPQHRVFLDAFYMDQYEVTTSRYGGFMRTSRREAPGSWKIAQQVGNREKPVIKVDWHDANAYCVHYGKRLPTEAEWEKAARGTDGRIYPWGNDAPTRQHANFSQDIPDDRKYYSELVAVGSREAGKSPYEVHDMAGNVWEWAADWYDEEYYQQSPERNPQGPSSGKFRVVRGGAWNNEPYGIRSALRFLFPPSIPNASIGFRCAQDVK